MAKVLLERRPDLCYSRKRLEAGPPSSQVNSVQVLKESSGLSEENVRSEVGDHKGYSVRRYRAE